MHLNVLNQGDASHVGSDWFHRSLWLMATATPAPVSQVHQGYSRGHVQKQLLVQE